MQFFGKINFFKKDELKTPKFCLILDNALLECSWRGPGEEDQDGDGVKNHMGMCGVAERSEGSAGYGKGAAFTQLQQSCHNLGRVEGHSFCVAPKDTTYSSPQNWILIYVSMICLTNIAVTTMT